MRHTARGNVVEGDNPVVPSTEKLPDGQHADHYVMSPEELAQGYVEPVREKYVHTKCGVVTRMPRLCAETYARDPSYYGKTFCCGCGDYFPVGEDGEFVWDGSDQKVGTRREG